MDYHESEKEESSDSEPILTTEAFDSLLININQDPFLDKINTKIDNDNISVNNSFFKQREYIGDCSLCDDIFFTIIYRIVDTFFFF